MRTSAKMAKESYDLLTASPWIVQVLLKSCMLFFVLPVMLLIYVTFKLTGTEL